MRRVGSIAVMVLLVSAASIAWSDTVEKWGWNGSAWVISETITLGGTYVDLGAWNADQFMGVTAGGGMDRIYKNGAVWEVENIAPDGSGIVNAAINGNYYGFQELMAYGSGGVQRFIYAPPASVYIQPLFTDRNYTSVASIAGPNTGDNFLAAKPTGGVDRIRWTGSTWARDDSVDPNNRLYVSLARDAFYGGGATFGAVASGGIVEIWNAGGWHSDFLTADTTTKYVDLAENPVGNQQVFAARADQGIDRYLVGAGWFRESITAAGKYLSLAANGDVDDQFFALVKPASTSTTWLGTTDSDWDKASNWDSGSVPNAVGEAVTFGGGGVVNATVDLTSTTAGRTVGAITFQAIPTTIQSTGGKALALERSEGNATVEVTEGAHQISAPLKLNSSATFNVGAGGTITVSSPISGSGVLVKQGLGKLVLSAANSHGGGTTLNAGVLSVADDASLGAAAVPLTFNGGTLQPSAPFATTRPLTVNSGGGTIDVGSQDWTLSNQISGPGALNKAGSGKLTLTGPVGPGGLAVTLGTLQLGDGVAASQPIQGNIDTQAALVFNNGDGRTYSGRISGPGSVTKIGAGTLTINGPFAGGYTGPTNINAGELRLTAPSAPLNTTGLVAHFDAGSGVTYDPDSRQVSAWSDLSLTGHDAITAAGAPTWNETLAKGLPAVSIHHTGDVQNPGDDHLTLTGDFAARQVFYVFRSPTPAFDNYGAVIGAGTDVSQRAEIYENGTNYFHWNPLARAVSKNGTPLSQPYIMGDITQWMVLGVNVSNPEVTRTWQIGRQDFYTCSLDIAEILVYDRDLSAADATAVSGHLGAKYGILNMLPDTSAVNVASGAALNLNGFSETIGPLSGQGTVQMGSGSLTVNSADAAGSPVDSTFSGTITGAGALGKTGPGTLTLDGNIAHSGGTVIVGGRLSVASDSKLGQAGVGITLAGGTLQTTGTAAFETARPITLTGNSGIETLATGGTVISTAITETGGSYSLAKSGSDTLTLTGDNTHTGGTIVNAGILQVAGDGNLAAPGAPLGFGGGTLKPSAAFDISRPVSLNPGGGTIHTNGFDFAISGPISGSGALTKTGAGILTLTGDNTFSGGATVNQGTLQGSSASIPGSVALVNDAKLVFDQGIDGVNAGVISGTGSVTKAGTAALTLSGENFYSGDTSITAGTLRLGGNKPAPPPTGGLVAQFDAGAGLVAAGGVVRTWADQSGSGHDAVLANGAPGLGAGPAGLSAVQLRGNDDWLSVGGSFVAKQALYVFRSPQARFSSYGSVFGSTVYDSNRAQIFENNSTVFHYNPYPLAVAKNGTPLFQPYDMGNITEWMLLAVDLSYPDNFRDYFIGRQDNWSCDLDIAEILVYDHVLSGDELNTAGGYLAAKYAVTTTYVGGSVPISNDIPDTSAVTVAKDATLDVNDRTETIGPLAGSGSVTLGAGQLTINSAANSEFSGGITGTGGLVKIGTSTLTLSGVNEYSGGTAVAEGTLKVGSASALPAGGSLTVQSGATVVLSSGLSAAGQASASPAVPVPEPGTLLLAAVAAIALAATAAWRRN